MLSLISLTTSASLTGDGTTRISLSPLSSRSAVNRRSSVASRLDVLATPLLRSHNLATMMLVISTISARDREATSMDEVLDAVVVRSWIRLRVVSTVRSSRSDALMTGDVLKIPSGSNRNPSTERPEGSDPLFSRMFDHAVLVLAVIIFATCSMKILCKGLSSSVARRSSNCVATFSICSARVEFCPRSSPAAEVV